MKIHLRDNYFDTEANREKFKNSPHVLSHMDICTHAVCGFGSYPEYITDDITKVECKKCLAIDEANFERGRDL